MSIDKLGARMLLVLLCVVGGGLLLWSAPALACPNEELRAGSSANLPDCRAYEMVSPPAKNGYDASGSGTPQNVQAEASIDGDAVVYSGSGAFPGSAAGVIGSYLAVRGPGGWSTQSLMPAQAFSFKQNVTQPMFAAFSPDLSRGVLIDESDSPSLVSGERVEATNLFLRDDASGGYSLLNVPAPGVEPLPYSPTFDGASESFATVVFDANGALTPEAPGGGVDNLYEWAGGAVSLVSLVSLVPPAGQSSCGPAGPACEPAPHGGRLGGEDAHSEAADHGSLVNAVSADGSRVFFTAEGNLYVRVDGATTVQVDASQGGPQSGGGAWKTAAGDGSEVFFTDERRLTAGSTAEPGKPDLYEYEVEGRRLTDLTPAPEADVLGVVNEASTDGSYVYFVARGDLTGAEEDSLHHEAQAGAENLYLSHDGAVSFLYTVDEVGETLYGRKLLLEAHNASRVTPDGHHLAFFASNFGFNGENAKHAELFEYDAESGQLVAICRCGLSEFRQESTGSYLNQLEGVFQYNRGISDDGARVFFDSTEPLVPQDSNGQEDVYEYERAGTPGGSCTGSSATFNAGSGGCLFLISTGTSTVSSYFADASPSGEDVFFGTSQQLVPADVDGAIDLYDARVDGGFSSPPEPSCLGDACLNVPSAPLDATPASLTFSGDGNVSAGEVDARVTPTAKLTSAQRRAAAVKACAKKSKSQRKRCVTQARRRYGAKARNTMRARDANTDGRAGK
jgi:Tol biopolymer transport system component